MVNTTLYYPKDDKAFSGYVSTIQSRVIENVDLASSSLYGDNIIHSPISAFEWSKYDPFASSVTYGWLSFSFKQKPFFISYYELGQRTDFSINFIDNWVFECSNNNLTWKILDRRSNIPGFSAKGEHRLFEIKKKGFYKFFRIRSLVENVTTIKRIEVYGFFCEEGMKCDMPLLPTKGCQKNHSINTIFFMVILISYRS